MTQRIPHEVDALSATRAKDRAKMVKLLVEAATNAGARATEEPTRYPRERRVLIEVEGGAHVRVTFDGESRQADTFVCTWNIDLEHRDRTFSSEMPSVNPYHGRKSTVISHGFAELRRDIFGTIRTLVEGRGYAEPEAEAA